MVTARAAQTQHIAVAGGGDGGRRRKRMHRLSAASVAARVVGSGTVPEERTVVVHPHRTGANGNNRVGARPPHKQRIGLSSYLQHTDNPLATETIPEEDEVDLEDTGSDIVGFDDESHSQLPQHVQLEDITPVASFYTASSKSPSPDSALQHSFERSTELDEAPVLRAPSPASTSSSTSDGKAAERAAASCAPRIAIADRVRSFEALSAAGDPFGAQLLPCAGLKDAYSSSGCCTCLR